MESRQIRWRETTHHGDSGWQPVVRRYGRRGVWNRREVADIHFVFVDNIHEVMGAKGLYSIFVNYGVVMDVFIPNKRRKLTRSRFGFVRYNCSVAAAVVVQKANGLWCDDRALKVKMADFGKEYVTKNKPTKPT
ncbi:serine/arginine-rich splicing factor SC35-like [Camellia sinensis]|uniref:serine/arginine-rich splicing factor SC35-like n=1 Tax=Camellia sinensis TaxID=4442 RepID=UPI001036C1C2|nr:serine/arginine-rich splicing factor SC35-like [Camellia sinensis]